MPQFERQVLYRPLPAQSGELPASHREDGRNISRARNFLPSGELALGGEPEAHVIRMRVNAAASEACQGERIYCGRVSDDPV